MTNKNIHSPKIQTQNFHIGIGLAHCPIIAEVPKLSFLKCLFMFLIKTNNFNNCHAYSEVNQL